MGRKPLSTNQFIAKATKIHGDRYNYSKSLYENNRTDVYIICSLHGNFYQNPKHHLNGRGCPTCGGTKVKTNNQFIRDAQYIHGNVYNYSEVEYINNKTKVSIIC